MVSEKVRVINKEGMHMRPAGLIAQTCGLMKSSVRISYNGKFYDCKSIIMLMSAGIGYGAELEVIAEGEDSCADGSLHDWQAAGKSSGRKRANGGNLVVQEVLKVCYSNNITGTDKVRSRKQQHPVLG